MSTEEIIIAIFIIDDDEAARLILNTILKNSNITNYRIFSDPNKLLEALHSEVQICILDYDLKHSIHNGVTLTQEILRQNSYCKCIIMSGYEDASIIKSFLNSGAYRYITKGEKGFSKNLVLYIEQAQASIAETFEFYSKVRLSMKKIMNLVNNGESNDTEYSYR